ncbi:MAG: GNAT family N-acetyltransferase [Pyrinomonadaceae bacterium]
MAVLKKIRSRLWAQEGVEEDSGGHGTSVGYAAETDAPEEPSKLFELRYDVRPMTLAQLDECWRLDQRCFVDGEAYSRDTFEYLLTAPEAIAYRAVMQGGGMAGFIVGLVEPDHTGHVTTVGVAPEHRRRRIAHKLMEKAEDGFRRRGARTVRLEVRSINTGAQALYRNMGYIVTQRLPRYYSNGGDGLLMVKALEG